MRNVQKSFQSAMGRVLSLALLLMVSTVAWAQQRITGTVQDDKGEPLIGVSVTEAGTQSGAVTDANGKFTLTVKQGARLDVSYIGYTKQTVAARNGMTVTLREDDQMLNEVVVVGYGTMRRKDVTSSITTVQAKDLNQGVFTDPGQMLQGKVAGLVVTSTGDPSGGSNIVLRGASTIRSEAMSPYYVIDGIPGVDPSMVAPDDIESIDVLRDASATAIYGSKAANGVIIITTKSGQEGRTNVSYNGYVGFENILKKLDMASADELRASGELPVDNGADVDWQKEVLRTGISHNHNVSINGGNKSTKYMASVNYMNHNGVIRGTDMNRINARALLSSTVLKDHLTLSVGVNAMVGKHNGVPVSDNKGAAVLDAMNYYLPTNPVRNADGSWFDTGLTQTYNPLSMINEDSNDFQWKRMQYIGKATLKIIEGLNLNANYSYNNRQRIYNYYNSTLSQLPYGGTSAKAHRETVGGDDHTLEIYGNFDRTFGKHKLGLMAGYTWEERMSNDGFGVSVYDFYDDALSYFNIAYANRMRGMVDINEGLAAKETIRNISFYGRLNYSFNSRYMLQATIRRDGSSVFGKNHRWGTFPSASIAWNIAEENFMKNQKVFDQLKLRAGYGVSGNAMGFGAYTATALYGLSSTNTSTINGVTYGNIELKENANPDLKWETTKMFNIGLDYAILGGRINGSIEFYHKKTDDMIRERSLNPNLNVVPRLKANVGEMTNKGIEFTINATPVLTKDFQWNTTLNLSHNKNTVDKLSLDELTANYISTGDEHNAYGNMNFPYSSVQRIMEGQPMGTFYTFEWAGYENGTSVYYQHDPVTNERLKDANGNYLTTADPTENDKTVVGNAQPKLVYGWNNTFTYKNWSLTAFIQGVLGNKIMNTTRAHFSARGLLNGQKNVLAEALSDPTFSTDRNFNTLSDRYLEKGDYLRLATLTLGYTFRNLNGWANDVTIYGTCNNLLTITGYKGIDPEVSLGGYTPGIDYRDSFYPHTRTFMVGVKINFGGSAPKTEAPKTVYVTDNSEIDRLNAEVNKLMAENNDLKNRKPQVETKVVKEKELVTYPHYVNFGLGKSEVSDAETVNLQYVADMIKAVPEKKFCIAGYADKQTGNDEINARLSQQRAQNVYKILTEKYGISEKQLTLDAKGGVDTMFLDNPDLSRSVVIAEVK